MYPNRTMIWRASLEFAEAAANDDFELAEQILQDLFAQMPAWKQ